MTTERDIQNQIDFARDKGFEQGLEQGLEQGRDEGREEGREEERVKIIKALKEQGVPEEVIRRVLNDQ